MLDTTEPDLSPFRKPGISLPLANGALDKKQNKTKQNNNNENPQAAGVDVNQLTHLHRRLGER